jgi:hypothetical protein
MQLATRRDVIYGKIADNILCADDILKCSRLRCDRIGRMLTFIGHAGPAILRPGAKGGME